MQNLLDEGRGGVSMEIVTFSDGTFMNEDELKKVQQEILTVLSNKGYSYEIAEYLLKEIISVLNEKAKQIRI